MEITRTNCRALLPKLGAALGTCDFFSVDFEFSGTGEAEEGEYPAGWSEEQKANTEIAKLMESPEVMYPIKAEKVKQLTLMQVGVSVFRHCNETVKVENFSLEVEDLILQHGEALRDEVMLFFDRILSSTGTFFQLKAYVNVAAEKEKLRRTLSEGNVDHSSLEKRLDGVAKRERTYVLLGILEKWEAIAHPVKRYTAQTFYAYLFPKSNRREDGFMLNTETVGSFMVEKTEINFDKWVREGLRFSTLSDYLDEREQNMKPPQTYPLDTDLKSHFPSELGSLSPFTEEELNYIQWSAGLPPPSGKFYCAKVPQVLAFARSGEKESSDDMATYIDSKFFNQEISALSAIGLSKTKKKTFTKKATRPSAQSQGGIESSLDGTHLLSLLLSASRVQKKPIVFHNGFTDLMFFVSALLGTLPPTLKEFKRHVHTFLPTLYDTRTLTCHPSIQHMALMRGRLDMTYEDVKRLMESDVAVDVCDPSEKISSHNAGYDAYITGSLFAYVTEALKKNSVKYTKLVNVVPLYGSIWYVHVAGNTTVLLHRKGLPIFYTRDPGSRSFIKEIRESITEVPLSVMYTGKGYAIYCCGSPSNVTDLTKKMKEFIAKKASGNAPPELLPINYNEVVKKAPELYSVLA
ncbi:ribonuclease [Angomonas deanei]|uniref:CAF1 family ribonuclease, putative n=1 Tax=Angomonas deanei TaxID=59799 RepID=A0A7G2CD79_9TRYP|nr:ribonuclease [Angomonas deanei]CAD2216804.1 CAF1 family ribonuclease, putative [Angomonas deanei]|eukprot:EPY33539.1 ribonuclease [Angomonas deanei]